MPKLPPNFPQSPFTITLDTIKAQCAFMTDERLQQTADDQILFFWAEVASFTLSGPIKEENETYRDSDFFHHEILDSAGNRVGLTDYCVPGDANDLTCTLGNGESEFVLLATNKKVGGSVDKVVLQILRKDRVVYRIGIADIEAEAWIKANPSRELIALG